MLKDLRAVARALRSAAKSIARIEKALSRKRG